MRCTKTFLILLLLLGVAYSDVRFVNTSRGARYNNPRTHTANAFSEWGPSKHTDQLHTGYDRVNHHNIHFDRLAKLDSWIESRAMEVDKRLEILRRGSLKELYTSWVRYGDDNAEESKINKVFGRSPTPPSSGDWIIGDEVVVVEDTTYIINGSILILDNGTLVLKNSTIIMNLSSDGQYRIEVNRGGNLTLINSTITAYNPAYNYYIKADLGSVLYIDGSEISHAGYAYGINGDRTGLWIGTHNVTIRGSYIHDNYFGIYMYAAENVTLEDVSIDGINTPYGIMIDHTINATLLNCELYNCGIVIDGANKREFFSHDITGCLVDGDPVYYIVNQTTPSLVADFGEYIIVNCMDVSMDGFLVEGKPIAIEVAYTWINISNTEFVNNTYSIISRNSDNVIVHKSRFLNCSSAIYSKNTTLEIRYGVFNNSYMRLYNTTVLLANSTINIITPNEKNLIAVYTDHETRLMILNLSVNLNADSQQVCVFEIDGSLINISNLHVNATASNTSEVFILYIVNTKSPSLNNINAWGHSFNGSTLAIVNASSVQGSLNVNNSVFYISCMDYNSDTYAAGLRIYDTNTIIHNSSFHIHATGMPTSYGYCEAIYASTASNVLVENCSFDGLSEKMSYYVFVYSDFVNNLTVKNSIINMWAYEGTYWTTAFDCFLTSFYMDNVTIYGDFYGFAPPDLYDTYYSSYFGLVGFLHMSEISITNTKIDVLTRGFALQILLFNVDGDMSLENITLDNKLYDDGFSVGIFDNYAVTTIDRLNVSVRMFNDSFTYIIYSNYNSSVYVGNTTATGEMYNNSYLIFMATARKSNDSVTNVVLNLTLYNISVVQIFRPAGGYINIRQCWATLHTYDLASPYFVYTLISYKPWSPTYFGPSQIIIYDTVVENTGPKWGTGIVVLNDSRIVLNNTYIEGFDRGLYIYNCNSCVISYNGFVDVAVSSVVLESCLNISLENNIINGSLFGVILDSSVDITLDANKLWNTGIILYGEDAEHFASHTITTSNKVNGKIVYYVANMNGYSVPIAAGQVIIANSSSITVSGVDISNTTVAVEVAYSTDITVMDSKFSNSMIGLYLVYTNDTTVTNNEFTRCGIFVMYSFNNSVDNNKVNSKPLLYVENARRLDITGEYGQIIVVNSKYITVRDTMIANTTIGIEFFGVDNSSILDSSISNTTLYGIGIISSIGSDTINNIIKGDRLHSAGIYMENSIDCSVVSNDIRYTERGIDIRGSSNTEVSNNNIDSCRLSGIYIEQANKTRISENIIIGSRNNIYIYGSQNNIIIKNRVENAGVNGLYIYMSPYINITHNVLTMNKYRGASISFSGNLTIIKNNITYNGAPWTTSCGIAIRNSEDARIYLNNFIGNSKHVTANSGKFDDGFIGNYWDDYVDVDSDSDGIWDNPYNVYKDIYDNYSLVNPVVNTPKFDELIETPLSNRSVKIQARVSDPHGIEAVVLRYYNGSSWITLAMTYNSSSGYYEATIPPLDIGTNVAVKVYARSAMDYWNMSNIFTYEVKEDMSPPTFYEILRQPEQPTDEESVTILVDVDDESGVSNIILSYNDGSAWINVSMTYVPTIRYYKAVIPTYPAGTIIFYKVYACDTYENWAVSSTYNYTVIERNLPEILYVERSIENPSDVDTVRIIADIVDESGVSEAILSYNDGAFWKNITMVYNTSTGLYEATIPPYPAGTTIRYMIYAVDIYENWAISDIYEYTVIETRPPVIYEVQRLVETPTDVDPVKIIVNATDDSAISEVILCYFDGYYWNNITMVYNTSTGLYEATIPPQSSGTHVFYKVYAIDIYGNTATSSEYNYMVIELRPPAILSVLRDIERPSDNDVVIIMANVTDDSGISEVILCYYNGSDWINVSMVYNSTTGYYEATIPQLPAGTYVEYYVYATDIYGNSAKSTTYWYTVIELNPPVIHNVTRSIEEPTEGESVEIYVSAEDDSGIAYVILSYSDGHSWYNITMTYNNTTQLYEALIPRYPAGTTIEYCVYVYDIYGNYVVSDLSSYTVKTMTETTKAALPLPPIIIAISAIAALVIVAAILFLRKKKTPQTE